MKEVIGHMADLHLGAGTAFGVYNPETGLNTFTERQVEAAEYAIQIMSSKGCTQLVIAGDIFDHPDPSSALIQAFQRVIELAVLKGMEVVLITGNHDKVNDRANAVKALYRNTDESVHYVEAGQPASIRGISYVMHHEDVAQTDEFVIGLYHGIVPGCTAGHIKLTIDGYTVGKGINAVLAGDVHMAQKGEFDGRVYYYPGSLVRLNFGEKDYTPGFGIATVIEESPDAFSIDYEFVSAADKSLVFVEMDATEAFKPKSNGVYKVTGPDHLRESVKAHIEAAGGVLYRYITTHAEVKESTVARRDELNVVGIVDGLDVEQVIKDFLRQYVKATESSGLKGDYRLAELAIQGFGPYVDAKLDFSGEDKSYAVLGKVGDSNANSNGAGKSYIFDAIKVCLFGTTYRGLPAGWSVNGKTASLRLTLQGERKLTIERTIGKTAGVGKHEIKVYIDDLEQPQDRLRDTQDLIQSLMGVSEQSFEVSTMIGKPSLSLVDRGSAWRVDYLVDLFNMNGIDAASEEISAQTKAAAFNLTNATTMLANQSALLGKLQSEYPPSPNLFELIAYKDELSQWSQAVADTQAKINNLQATAATAQAHNRALQAVYDAANRDALNAGSGHVSAEVSRSFAQNKLAEARASVDANICPLCKNKLADGHAAQHIFDLTMAVNKAEEAESKSIEALNAAAARLEEAQARKTSDWQDDSVDDTVLRAELLKATDTMRHYDVQVKTIDAQSAAVERHQAVVDATDEQTKLASATQAIAQAETVKWAYISSKFNAAAIKESLIKSVSDTLNSKATTYLSRIFGNTVGVRFDASLQVTKAKSIPKFEIYVLRDGAQVPFEQYSSGERGAVRVAVDLAVSDLVAQVNPARFRFLIFDEAFDNLDAAKSEAVADLINELVATRGTVLAVAHTFKMSTKYGGTLLVEKGQQGSTITQQ